MVIFSTLPSYRWSPSRRKYVLAWGLETTAIIPFGARTIPSSRSVLTCSPALPGGRFGAALAVPWLTKDSKGSRRAAFSSLSAAALGALSGPAGFSTALPADFAAALLCSGFLLALTGCFAGAAAVGFAAAWGAGFAVCAEGFAAAVGAGFAGACAAGLAAVGEAGLAGVCEAGLAGVCVAGFAGACCAGFAGGFEACCAACAPCSATESPVAGGSGFICARKRGAAAPIKSPSPSVITERIVRLFPLRGSQPRCQAWLRLQEPHRNQQAW